MSKKPIVLLNHNGFYDKLIAFLDEMVSNDFSKVRLEDVVHVVDTTDDLIEYLKNYNSSELPDKFA